MKLYVECCKSKDKETTYHALKCDLGYRTIILSMEKDICAEMANVTIADLYKMKADEKKYVNTSANA